MCEKPQVLLGVHSQLQCGAAPSPTYETNGILGNQTSITYEHLLICADNIHPHHLYPLYNMYCTGHQSSAAVTTSAQRYGTLIVPSVCAGCHKAWRDRL